ncbi:MAG: peptidase T [Calditrichaeota bacterium]|nr:MAG: peptidase T [Calditrichota bacterium]MBL1206931.1 peptidase T [Calditrichota bacterium]NOG46758.1 peptidase T [Calditrichota bacterium]
MTPKIIIHGGAWDIPKILHKAHLKGIKDALNVGREILSKSDDSLETVLAIIKNLEDNPTFDAGKGSFLNSAGEVEMDAAIMVGEDLSIGAVAAIQNVKNPIEVANLVRTKSQHVLLVGVGAASFASAHNTQAAKTENLLVGREKKLHTQLSKQKEVNIKSFFEKKVPSDTVGAVVINSRGQIVVGTSTGGTPHKMAGRVGDCPIAGSGFFADNLLGGVACTGWGEGILRVQLAREVIDRVKAGVSPQKAVNDSVAYMRERVNGDGGVIFINNAGKIAFAFNTPFMAVGAATCEKINFVSLGHER